MKKTQKYYIIPILALVFVLSLGCCVFGFQSTKNLAYADSIDWYSGLESLIIESGDEKITIINQENSNGSQNASDAPVPVGDMGYYRAIKYAGDITDAEIVTVFDISSLGYDWFESLVGSYDASFTGFTGEITFKVTTDLDATGATLVYNSSIASQGLGRISLNIKGASKLNLSVSGAEGDSAVWVEPAVFTQNENLISRPIVRDDNSYPAVNSLRRAAVWSNRAFNDIYGLKYNNSLGTHSNSEVEFDISDNTYPTLEVTTYIGTTRHTIYCYNSDGLLINNYDLTPIRGDYEYNLVTERIDVQGVSKIVLKTWDGAAGYWCDMKFTNDAPTTSNMWLNLSDMAYTENGGTASAKQNVTISSVVGFNTTHGNTVQMPTLADGASYSITYDLSKYNTLDWFESFVGFVNADRQTGGNFANGNVTFTATTDIDTEGISYVMKEADVCKTGGINLVRFQLDITGAKTLTITVSGNSAGLNPWLIDPMVFAESSYLNSHLISDESAGVYNNGEAIFHTIRRSNRQGHNVNYYGLDRTVSSFGGFIVNSVEFALTPGEYEGLVWHYWQAPMTIQVLDDAGTVLQSYSDDGASQDKTGAISVSGATRVKLSFSDPNPANDYSLFHFRLVDFRGYQEITVVDNHANKTSYQLVNNNTTVSSLTTADYSAEGLYFENWYSAEDFSADSVVSGDTVITKNMKLYPRYATKHDVVFNDDQSQLSASQVFDGGKATEITAPEKVGYNFDGWFEKEGDSYKATAFDFSSAITNDVTLYAKYSLKQMTVTFVNGDQSVPTTVGYGSKVTAPESPEKVGYDFDGWFVKTGEEYSANAFDFNSAITEDITLHAVFSLKQMTVTFVDGDQSTPVTVDYGTKVTAKSADKVGHTFVGWFTKSGEEYSANAFDFNSNITENVTLYAVYTVNKMTVTFVNGEESNPVTLDYGTTVEEPTAPQKEGYTFDGWYVDENYSAKYDFSKTVTENFSLYAKFVENAPTVNVPLIVILSVVGAGAIATVVIMLLKRKGNKSVK